MTIDPDLAVLAAANPALDPWSTSVEALRRVEAELVDTSLRRPHDVPIPVIDDDLVDAVTHQLAVRIYRPETTASMPTVLFLHGGGWVMGGLDAADSLARYLAHRLRATLVSGSYRLAPENPFPAAHDDVITLTKWVLANAAALGGDVRRVAIAGESAGANLAASAAIDLQGHGLSGQLLVVPATDLTSARRSANSYLADRDPMLPSASVDWCIAQYLGRADGSSDLRASPLLLEDATELGPTLVVTAECDPLRDDGRAFVKKLQSLGATAELAEYAGMTHTFSGLRQASSAASDAVDDYCLRFSRLVRWRSD